MAVPFNVAGRMFYTLGFARCITTSASLSSRGIRGVVRGLGLREEELHQLGPDDLEAMADVSLDTFTQQADHIEGDARKYQHHLRKKTIHHKYFKSYGPVEKNLLTWSMKEQLKYLHSTDPDQWTPEVLSKSFPISTEGVVRLLRCHRLPKSQAERERHDRAVVAYWKTHMKGQIGSYKILEKVLSNKFISEKLPSPVLGMKDVVSMLESLRFDGEQPYDPKPVKKRNKLPRQSKMQGKSFSSIIEEYEFKSSPGEKQPDYNTDTNTLTRISGPPQYEGSYTRITGAATTHRRSLPSNKNNKMMTFSEFMRRKT